MLLEFKCSNHKSIKDQATFSMIAGSDTTSDQFLKEYRNIRVLRSAVIYGANGSGKSNFINALSFMRSLVCNSINHQPGEGVFQAGHKLNPAEVPSEYSIQFVKNDIRYAYGFSVKQNLIQEEYLYYYPIGRQVKIFERIGMNVKPGDRFKSAFDVSISILKANRLFLSCAANYSNVKETEEAFMFFYSDLVVYDPKINNWTEYSVELMQNDDHIKKAFIQILQALGTGIKDVKVKLDTVKREKISKEIPTLDVLRNFRSSQEGNRLEAKVIYDKFEVDLMAEESTGVKRLFQMICPILDILAKGKILICDGFDSGLHESILFQIVELFYHYTKEPFAQLIFSTHDTSLLDSDLFRRDQVWLAQLNEERATDLYSLSEIRNIRKTENLKKGYISGKYGGIPTLNQKVLQGIGKWE